MTKQKYPAVMRGMALPVQAEPARYQDGFSVGHACGQVVIAVTHGGVAWYIVLSDAEVDAAAGLLADAIVAANRHDVPSLGSVQ